MQKSLWKGNIQICVRSYISKMCQSPDCGSTKLSEVMEDIGVNEEMLMKSKHLYMLIENIVNVTYMSVGENVNVYFLGSQSEGTTTIGLNSDLDILCVNHEYNVMQDWSEWKQNMNNYLMIRDENVTPGNCFLQRVRPDVPFLATHIPDDDHVSDSIGRILLKNTFVTGLREDAETQGPSNTVSGIDGYSDIDIVCAMHCVSLPQSASNLLERQGILRRPSSEITKYAASNGCFVVGTSSKISRYPELEWRISTSLAERCLMSNLNITQIQCYVLMKIVLKTFLNPRKANGMSSFMCKTILFHCIEKTEQSIWMKNNLSTCLKYCLHELHRCVYNDNCPHYMIPENNLMAGQFTDEVKYDLLTSINDIIQNDCRYLFCINIDCIGQRLQAKLDTSTILRFPTQNEIKEHCLINMYINLAQYINQIFWGNFHIPITNSSIRELKQLIRNLTDCHVSGNRLEQLASGYIAPLVCSTLGSALASSCIRRNNPVSHQSVTWLSLGFNSDATSGRLKLASVFYCTGDMYRAEDILRQIEREYDFDNIVPICECCHHGQPFISLDLKKKDNEQTADYFIRCMTSYCVKFLPIEINCVPRELRYEMMRSTQDDLSYISYREKIWMDYAVVDSLPLLYFLQYKTYDHLQNYQDKEHALNNLKMSVVTVHGFGHRETALNLLGQCMEQENKPSEALHCYMRSLQQRARNNAAKILICCLLAKLVRNM